MYIYEASTYVSCALEEQWKRIENQVAFVWSQQGMTMSSQEEKTPEHRRVSTHREQDTAQRDMQ